MFKYAIGILILTTLWKCGQRGAPSGGPKDTQSPKIIKAYPNNQSANYAGNSVELKFDEYVTITGLKNEFIISPPMKTPPTFKLKGKKLIITFQDTLLANTTYSMFLGKGVKDFNEGNPLDSNLWVFSTGSYIDSLSCSGMVKDAFTQEAEEGMLIGLYPYAEASDSLPSKQLPKYFSNLTDGKFEFNNIAAGKYLVFGVQDMNNNYLYDLPNEKIAYLLNPIEITPERKTDSLVLYSTLPWNNDLKLAEVEIIDGSFIRAQLNKPARELPKINVIGDSIKIDTITRSKQEVKFILSKRLSPQSSISLEIEYSNGTDTLNLKSSPVIKNWLSPNFSGKSGNPPSKEIKLSKNKPFKIRDVSKIVLFRDSLLVDTAKYKLIADQNYLRLQCNWKADREYKFMALPGAFIDRYGSENADTLSYFIPIAKKEIWGLMTLNFDWNYTSPLQHNQIIQLLQDEDIMRENVSAKIEGKIFWQGLPTKPYRLRCIFDQDNNGVWTPGSYYLGTYPEHVVYYSEKIELRPNWELDINWKIK